MHVLTLRTPLDLGPVGTIAPGDYLCEDIPALQMAAQAERGTATLHHQAAKNLLSGLRFDSRRDWNGKSILVMRNGGIGADESVHAVWRLNLDSRHPCDTGARRNRWVLE